MSTKPPSQLLAYVMLPVAALCWAGNHVVGRAIAWQMPPALLNALRWAIVAAIVWVVSAATIRSDWPRVRAKAGVIVLLALLGGAIFGTLQFVGLQYTQAVNVAVFNSVAPALIVAASVALFGDRTGPIQLAGVVVSLVGVLVIASELDPRRLATLRFNIGDVIVIANMGLWAIYSACLRLRPAIDLRTFLFATAAASCLANLPFIAVELALGYVPRFTPLTVSAVLYAAVFSSLIAYFCWMRGVEMLGPSRAAVFLHLVPVFGAILAFALLGERLGMHHAVGFAAILAGVYLAARPVR